MKLLCGMALFVVAVSLVTAAPDRTVLQTGNGGVSPENQQFVEEVVVESILQVRNPTVNRQARTNTQNTIENGARVFVSKTK